METASITAKLDQLPDNLREEVIDFLDFLLEKHRRQAPADSGRNRPFGLAKGQYKMGVGFDEPLEDFKDYM